jgi:hypothetical protein
LAKDLAKDWLKKRGLVPRFFVAPRHCAPRAQQTHIALQIRVCYSTAMFPGRQSIASRVVLDDRSRLPWRFFGRLTTAALAA